MWWIPLAACGLPEVDVTLTGVTWDGPGPDAPPLGDVEVEVLTRRGRSLATTTSDGAGRFEVTVPGGDPVFVVLRRDGYAATSFPGIVGIDDAEQPIEDHALYALSRAALDAERAAFAGCPGGAAGAAVVGDLRLYGAIDPETGEAPIVTGGKAFLDAVAPGASGGDGSLTACYLEDSDAPDAAYDPGAFLTGASGRFGLFGLPGGVWELEVRVEATSQLFETATYPVYLPDDPDAVSPWYPALIEFPY